ncbi:MAG TPA: maleylpyruvate isomerase N-terminal domain-containing protein [Candidatus Nanopelagicales bacterium]|nr:maleylpyruvate isomerase N-terminal domain-containing protein [Candidatus Nanopelagicales bacterium]
MRDLSFSHVEAVEALVGQIDEFRQAVSTWDDLALLGPSRCHGWSVLDLVTHVRLGIEELAIASTSRTDLPADHDAASYWRSHPDDRDVDPVTHILWLRRVASAHRRPSAAVAHLESASTHATAAVRAMPEGVVPFQGQRLRSGDLLATWVVELAVHQLDLGSDAEAPSGLGWTRATLEALADADLPAGLDDRSAVLVGLGRIPAPSSLALADSFPVSL